MKIATMACASLALTGCAGMNLRMAEGKGLAASQQAVASAGEASHALYVAGKLSKPQIRTIDGWVDDADDVSQTARCAYADNDSATIAAAFAQLATLATAITALNHGTVPPVVAAFATQTCTNPAPVAAVVKP